MKTHVNGLVTQIFPIAGSENGSWATVNKNFSVQSADGYFQESPNRGCFFKAAFSPLEHRPHLKNGAPGLGLLSVSAMVSACGDPVITYNHHSYKEDELILDGSLCVAVAVMMVFAAVGLLYR